jgi:hypothetical protein
MFKKAIKANGETIINLFGFTFRDNIFEWGENYVQDHPNYTFEKYWKQLENKQEMKASRFMKWNNCIN